jgi:hypothetical protein
VDSPSVFGEGNRKHWKGKAMSNNNEKRVLSRMGARQLTHNEVEQVAGGKLTFATALITGTTNNPDGTFDQ